MATEPSYFNFLHPRHTPDANVKAVLIWGKLNFMIFNGALLVM
jgi:hypothetical protein